VHVPHCGTASIYIFDTATTKLQAALRGTDHQAVAVLRGWLPECSLQALQLMFVAAA
jgi:hypothetical protein